MTKITEYATKVAIEAKASGFGVKDLGCFYDDDWNLTDAEWEQVCDEAIDLYDTVAVPAETYRSWAKVHADGRAEDRAERRVCYGEQAYFNDL
jgi:hypothetical protein